jgi:hypothetical protein
LILSKLSKLLKLSKDQTNHFKSFVKTFSFYDTFQVHFWNLHIHCPGAEN